ncbi:MAG: hypothetical protein DF168_00452 [Candidatus Moanabacter tarae]|uniref:Uncharacterized protein n=1 Tax=Candidatus Moanibacter tarae TaxID=2200854 RepID=A0A2Z4ABN2_9BACT|nr:MAG: hypothetical protein DF168_00452 [Candidatus Moanabacter tarae]|tara:strand:+ start:71433 stop:71831 length:399 start_codon:yes stop_codon:yes gene_type:complete
MKFKMVPKLLVIQDRFRSIFFRTGTVVLTGLSAVILVIALTEWKLSATVLPDFSSIGDVSAKKRAFLDFLLPIVERENLRILNNRFGVKEIAVRFSEGKPISNGKIKWLKRLAKKYGISVPEKFSMDFSCGC